MAQKSGNCLARRPPQVDRRALAYPSTATLDHAPELPTPAMNSRRRMLDPLRLASREPSATAVVMKLRHTSPRTQCLYRALVGRRDFHLRCPIVEAKRPRRQFRGQSQFHPDRTSTDVPNCKPQSHNQPAIISDIYVGADAPRPSSPLWRPRGRCRSSRTCRPRRNRRRRLPPCRRPSPIRRR
jgi:hypothetical protein